MNPLRKWQVYGLLATFLGGHAVAIVKTRELWPFSRYPMYAKPQRSAMLNQFSLVGMTPSGGEVSLTAKHLKIAAPMLRKQLAALAKEQKRKPQRVRTKLQQYIDWYHAKGNHKRTPIVGVRLYHIQYELTAAQTKERQPSSKVLIAEYSMRAPSTRGVKAARSALGSLASPWAGKAHS